MTIGTSVTIENKKFKLFLEKGEFYFSDGLKEFIEDKYSIKGNIEGIKNTNGLEDILFPYNQFKIETVSNGNVALNLHKGIINNQKIKDKKGFIYLVTDGVYTKIGGTTYNPKKRLAELQTGNALKLEIVGYYSCDYLHTTERIIQNSYKDKNVLNEWFLLSEKDSSDILGTKYSFKDNKEIKTLSHISILNIMTAQKFLLEDSLDSKMKLIRRVNSKLIVPKYIRRTLDNKMYSDGVKEKYLSNKVSRKHIEKIRIDSLKLSRLIKEAESISNSISKINKDMYNYTIENGIEYDEENYMWVNSNDYGNPLKYNNGRDYTCKISDIPNVI